MAAPIDDATKRAIEDHLLSPAGLTEHESTFNRNDVLRAWCDALPSGAPIEDVEALADGLEDRLEVVPLDGIPGRGPVIRAANGRVLSALPAGRRFSTFDLLNTERCALDLALRLLDGDAAVCHDEDLLAALRGAPTLSEEQRSAVIRMTTSGNGVDILTAPAGAGKTFALAAAREAWERSGYRVSGAAHTGVAADEITNAAGIPSTTIARLRIAIDNNEPGGLDDRSVLIIDEAGPAGTPAPRPRRHSRRGRTLRRQGRARRRSEATSRDRSRRTVRRADLTAAHDRTPRQPTPARRMGTRSTQPTPRRRPLARPRRLPRPRSHHHR